MSNKNITTAVQNTKRAKVILRKPVGVKPTTGWSGEVIFPDKSRKFVPEYFNENWSDEELNMSKAGHIVKAIADSTRYAAEKNYDCSDIIMRFGIQAMEYWDAFLKATDKRRTAKKTAQEGKSGEEAKKAWDDIKDEYNSAVRRCTLKMELLAEDIFDGKSPAKSIG